MTGGREQTPNLVLGQIIARMTPNQRQGGEHAERACYPSLNPTASSHSSRLDTGYYRSSGFASSESSPSLNTVTPNIQYGLNDEDDYSSSITEDDDNPGLVGEPKSAAERLAEKRRMKRFRSVPLIPILSSV